MKSDDDGNFNLGDNLESDFIKGLINDPKVTYVSTLVEMNKIPLHGERESYIKELSKVRQVTQDSIKKDLKKHQPLDRLPSQSELKIEVTGDAKEKALSLLNDKDILERFLNDSELLGCVGEDENKIAIYLALTSRKLDDPINLIVKGESSAGKSFLVDSVTRFFPKEDVLAFTAMTPKALYHRKDSLKHKVLIIYEQAGAEESDYSIRTLQSEKKLVFSYPCKDSATGQFETQDIEVEGPIAYVETTTKTRVHPENETRCFELFIDESEAQTQRIFNVQNRKYEGTQPNVESILTPWVNAQRLLEPFPVILPYMKHIQFPTKPLRARRDRLRFLTLIEASALLHQRQREKKEINGKLNLVATISDYWVAYTLAAVLLERSVKGVSPRLKELIEAAEELDAGFSRKELQEKLKDWDPKTINKYLEDAEKNGYIEISDGGGKGKAYKYDFVKSTDDNPIALLHPEALKELMDRDKSPDSVTEDQIAKMTTNRETGIGYFNPLKSLIKPLNAHNDQ
jgi:hypothetical protein